MSKSISQIEVHNIWKVFGDALETALQPEHASKSRDEIRQELGLVIGLRDVSFAVDTGEVFVVMGLSGSGKSTLVRSLIRLTEPTAGQIFFDRLGHPGLLSEAVGGVPAQQGRHGLPALRPLPALQRCRKRGVRLGSKRDEQAVEVRGRA